MNKHLNIPDSVWAFLRELASNSSIDAMILFGSRAFGDHDERSDVDIAIVGSCISRLEWARMRDAAYCANSLYWISLIHYDRNPPALKKRIDQTGVVIYVRTEAT